MRVHLLGRALAGALMPRKPMQVGDEPSLLVCRRCGKVPANDVGFTIYKGCGHTICDHCLIPEPFGAYRRWRCPKCRGKV